MREFERLEKRGTDEGRVVGAGGCGVGRAGLGGGWQQRVTHGPMSGSEGRDFLC